MIIIIMYKLNVMYYLSLYVILGIYIYQKELTIWKFKKKNWDNKYLEIVTH